MFNFSPLNYAMTSGNQDDSMNIYMNQLQQKLTTDSMLYSSSVFNFAPTNLCQMNLGMPNPMADINSIMGWMKDKDPSEIMASIGSNFGNMGNLSNMGNWGNWGNMGNWGNWGGFNFGNVTNNTPSNNDSSSVGSSEYESLKTLLTKYQELYGKDFDGNLKDKFKETLNKSGTTEEKLEALKDLYKRLDKTKMKKAMLDITDYKTQLTLAGYNFDATNAEKDKELKSSLNSIHSQISGKGVQLAMYIRGEAMPDILRMVSYWNDKYKDGNNRSILRFIASNITSDNSTNHKRATHNLAMSLVNYADEFKSKTSGNYPKLTKLQKEVSEALEKAEKDFNKNNVNALAAKFEKLYASLRVLEAKKINHTIKANYGFVNKIANDDKDFVDENLVVSDTKEDLAKEGISLTDGEVDELSARAIETYSNIDDNNDTAEKKIEALMNEDVKALKETDKAGVYTTTAATSNEPAHFYVIKDDKLVELKGVKGVDANGTCTTINNKKITLEAAKNNAEEVSAQDILDYNDTLTRVNNEVAKGNLIPCSSRNLPVGVKVYKSKGIKENQLPDYYVVKDGKLKQINCKSWNKYNDKFAMPDGRYITFDKLKSDDFLDATNSEINTHNKNAEKNRQKKADTIQARKDAAAAAAKKLKQNYNPPAVTSTNKAIGTNIADKLIGSTTDEAWQEVLTEINGLNKDNINAALMGYSGRAGNCFILKQIATEEKCNFLGLEICGDKRPVQERITAIKKIITCVIEHCGEYGIKNKDENSYKELKKALSVVNKDNVNNPDKVEQWDKLIQKVIKIK